MRDSQGHPPRRAAEVTIDHEDSLRKLRKVDLTAESTGAAGEVVPDRTPPATDNRRSEQRDAQPKAPAPQTSTDRHQDERRQDVSHRYGQGGHNRPAPWPKGPTRPLPPLATRPTIPAAREATVELPPLASITAPEPATSGQLPPTQVPSIPDLRPRQRGARSGPVDGVSDSWALVVRAQRGDKDAFAEIYHRYLDPVFRFVYFRVTNRQIAEDLTAETFLRALKRIGSVTYQGRDIGAWLITIARNLVADHFKSGRNRLETLTGDVLDTDAEEHGPEGSPELAVVEHITNVALLTAVQQLNPEQRDCIVLRFLKGFSVAETAQAMGKNEGAIKALQYRAVRALHRLLPDGFQQ